LFFLSFIVKEVGGFLATDQGGREIDKGVWGIERALGMSAMES